MRGETRRRAYFLPASTMVLDCTAQSLGLAEGLHVRPTGLRFVVMNV